MTVIETLKTLNDSDLNALITELSTAELGLINGVTAGNATASKAAILDADKRIAGLQFDQEARTATSDGLTTAIISSTGQLVHVPVTSANAAHIVVLPTPTPGRIVILTCGANGYELRSSAPATVGIGGGTGASAESAIPANSLALAVCISATNWVGLTVTAATLAAIEAAA